MVKISCSPPDCLYTVLKMFWMNENISIVWWCFSYEDADHWLPLWCEHHDDGQQEDAWWPQEDCREQTADGGGSLSHVSRGGTTAHVSELRTRALCHGVTWHASHVPGTPSGSAWRKTRTLFTDQECQECLQKILPAPGACAGREQKQHIQVSSDPVFVTWSWTWGFLRTGVKGKRDLSLTWL